MQIGERIRKARESRGWPQQRLAVEAGVGIVTVSQVEMGKPARLSTLEKLCRALDLKLSVSVTDKRAA